MRISLFPHFHISVDHALEFDHFNRGVGDLAVLVYNFLMTYDVVYFGCHL